MGATAPSEQCWQVPLPAAETVGQEILSLLPDLPRSAVPRDKCYPAFTNWAANSGKALKGFSFNGPRKSGVVTRIFYPVREVWLAETFVKMAAGRCPLSALTAGADASHGSPSLCFWLCFKLKLSDGKRVYFEIWLFCFTK